LRNVIPEQSGRRCLFRGCAAADAESKDRYAENSMTQQRSFDCVRLAARFAGDDKLGVRQGRWRFTLRRDALKYS